MTAEVLARISRMVGREIQELRQLTPVELEALLNAAYSGEEPS